MEDGTISRPNKIRKLENMDESQMPPPPPLLPPAFPTLADNIVQVLSRFAMDVLLSALNLKEYFSF